MGRIVVGTSSWADPGFVEEWYPPGLPARDRLPWYAEHFEAVELNSSFYAIPEARTVERWAAVTPDEFTFDVKRHRLLSQPGAHELDELAPIVKGLSPNTVELRFRAWARPKRLESTLAWMEEHGAAFVCTDGPQGKAPTMMPPVDAATRDDLAYFRAHGRNVEGYMRGKSVAERFAWDYGDDELRELVAV